MFKNLTIYRVGPEWQATLTEVEEKLQKHRFIPCGASQPASLGWVEPRGHAHGQLVEAVAGQWIFKLMTEKKILPASVVKRAVDDRMAKIEKETGRKPGRKQAKELKEELMLELLPKAFTRQDAVAVWWAPEQRMLFVNAGSHGRADEVVGALAEAMGGLPVSMLQTNSSPAIAMAAWLTEGQAPAGFTVDRECELKSSDEMKATVRYTRHTLDMDEVRQHISQGKLPTRVALTWGERVSFVLTDSLAIKKLEFLDGVFEGREAADEGFDADVAISTGELARLVPDLIAALGGEMELQKPQLLDASAASDDELYEQACAIVRENLRASISLVQRHLRIGYNRAARLLEAMEAKGVVTPMDSSGVRSVRFEVTA